MSTGAAAGLLWLRAEAVVSVLHRLKSSPYRFKPSEPLLYLNWTDADTFHMTNVSFSSEFSRNSGSTLW